MTMPKFCACPWPGKCELDGKCSKGYPEDYGRPDIVDRLKRRIAPLVGRAGWGSVETEHGLTGDAIAEIERLRAENAALWERVKRFEPLADPHAFGSGRTHTGEDG